MLVSYRFKYGAENRGLTTVFRPPLAAGYLDRRSRTALPSITVTLKFVIR